MKFLHENLKYGILILAFVVIVLSTLEIQQAFAATVEWREFGSGAYAPGATVSIAKGNADDLSMPNYAFIRVTGVSGDTPALVGETINVLITSSQNPSGIVVTATDSSVDGEYDTGPITFMTGELYVNVGETVTVTISDPDCAGSCSTGSPDTLSGIDGIFVNSEEDVTPIFIDLKETGDDTKIFTAKFKVRNTGSASTGTEIEVNPGTVVTVNDLTNGAASNLFVIPNPDTTRGAINAAPQDTVLTGAGYKVKAAFGTDFAELGWTIPQELLEEVVVVLFNQDLW